MVKALSSLWIAWNMFLWLLTSPWIRLVLQQDGFYAPQYQAWSMQMGLPNRGNSATINNGQCGWSIHTHRRQEPFWVARKTYTKPSTFVKYMIELVCAANPITYSKFAEGYVTNNKANQIFWIWMARLGKIRDEDITADRGGYKIHTYVLAIR